MNDFDTRIGQVLNELIDDELGPSRPAPTFDPRQLVPQVSAPRRLRPVAQLLAAAAVVLVAVGVVVLAAQWHTGSAPSATQPPQRHTNAPPSATTPSATNTTASTSATRPSATSTAPARNVVHLQGATLTLPAGWVARPAEANSIEGGWCLEPATLHALDSDCPVRFAAIGADGRWDVPGQDGFLVDTNFTGATPGNYAQCVKTADPVAADRTVAGRAADYRSWRFYGCSGRDALHGTVEEYTVVTDPGFWFRGSADADGFSQRAFDALLASAVLPAADTAHPLRFCDTGIIRSASLQSDGYHIALDRTYPTTNQNQNRATYPYVIPRTLVTGAAPAVGDGITVHTNGRVVTSY